MFRIILLSVFTLMHIYVFWRVSSVPVVKRLFHRNFLFGIGIVLWGAFLSGFFFGHGRKGALAAILELIGMTWFGTVFLACVSFLALDIFTGFGLFFRRRTIALRGWALVAAG